MKSPESTCPWQAADHAWHHNIRSAAVVFALSVLAITDQVAAQAPATAAAKTKSSSEEKVLTTDDKIDIKITYFKGTGGKESGVVVLLHGKGGQRRLWSTIDHILQESGGYAVVAVDLRGHGDSQLPKSDLKKAEYQAMAEKDMKAVKEFLLEEHQKGQLNINKLGIVACDFSASVALAFTSQDWDIEPFDDGPDLNQRTPRGQDVQALALISPDTTTPGLFATKAAMSLRQKPVAIMIATSEKNTQDAAMAKKLFEQVSFKKDKEREEKLSLKKSPENLHGMDLLKDKQIRASLYEFLDKYVKNHKTPWADRRSRLERE